MKFSPLVCVWLLSASATFAQPVIDDVDIPNASRELRVLLYERHDLREEIQEAETHLERMRQREQSLSQMIALRMQLDEVERKIDEATDEGAEQRFAALERQAEQLELKIDHLRSLNELDEALQEQRETLARLERSELDELAQPVVQLVQQLERLRAVHVQLHTIYLQGSADAAAALEDEAAALEEKIELGDRYVGLLADLREAYEEEDQEAVVEVRERLDALAERLRGELPDTDFLDSSAVDDPSRQPIPITEQGLASVAEVTWESGIVPLLRTYCFDCHSNDSDSGELNLERLVNEFPIVVNRDQWINVLEQAKNRVMPPEDGTQPEEAERGKLVLALHRAIYDFDYSGIDNPGYEPARRLTHDEYDNTIRDLFGLDLRPTKKFPLDLTGSSGFDNSANTLFVQPLLMERYIGAAEAIVEAALPSEVEVPPSAVEALLFGAVSRRDLDQPDQLNQLLRRFLLRAYRRPATTEELDRARQQFEQVRAAGSSAFEALKLVLRTALISPKFLLRSERQPDSGEVFAINDWELASRLSYFLWSSMPDERLFELAAAGQLSQPDTLRAEVERMIDDPKSASLGTVFAAQWLGSRQLGTRVRMDPIDNPWCTDSLMGAMRQETAMFFHTLVQEDQSIPRLIDADFTFLNEELAKHYKIRGIRGDAMRRVQLRGEERGGIFAHGSLLAVTSFPYRTSPVVRGKWILADVLGTPPPPPPPNVSELPEEIEENDRLTFREKLELHRTAPNCYACHSQMDPLGFSLEGYDYFGRIRQGRGRSRPDVRGKLPNGTEFEGLSGLKQVIVEQRLEDLCRQVASKMLSYALGRQLEYYDETAVRNIVAAVEQHEYRFQTLVHEIVNSYPFRYKQRQPHE